MEQGDHSRKEKTDLHQRIRYWRERSGMRPVDLARALNMSESIVSRWEAGTATPSTGSLHRIAGVLDVSMVQFYGELPDTDEAA